MTKEQVIQTMLAELKRRGLVLKNKDIADKLKIDQSYLSAALHDKNNCLTIPFMVRINEAYGSIFNIAWIATGEGEMLASKPEEQTFNVNMGTATSVGNNNTITTGSDEINALRAENDSLHTENIELKKELANKEKEIARLEGRIETYKEMLNK